MTALVIKEDIKPGAYPIGKSFKLLINKEPGFVSITGRNDRKLFNSLPYIPFIKTSIGDDFISNGKDGNFKIVEITDDSTTLQTITKITSSNDFVELQGLLSFEENQKHIEYSFRLKEHNGKQLDFDIQLFTDKKFRILFTFESDGDEDFYGFGEQFSFSTLKGQKVPILVREQGVGRGQEHITSILNDPSGVFSEFAGGDSFTTYCAVPQFISTRNRCVFLKNSEYSSFDLRALDRVTIRLNSTSLKGRLIDSDDLLDLVSEYTQYSGRMQKLPDWVLEGAIVGMQGGKDKVRKVVKQLQALDTPIAALWLQDWCGKRVQTTPYGVEFKRLWWNWESDDVLYPDWDSFVKTEMKQQNIRVLAYVNTFLTNVQHKTSFRRNLFLEAQANEYLVKDPSTNQALIISSGKNIEAGILDLTHPGARQWFKTVIKDQVWGTGVSGMMIDFGEYLPYHSAQASLYSGVSPEVYKNLYPQEWAKLHSEIIQELQLQEEAVGFYRAGYTRTPGYINLMWAGDQNVAWDEHDGIKSAVTGMLSGGFSGFSITHSDIGGYTTIYAPPHVELVRSKELLFRWMELSVFTAAFRTHEGIIPDLNAQFYDDQESLSYFSFAAKLFASLAPYRKHLVEEAHTKGWPLMRHLVFYYPHDPVVRQIKYQQYLFGKSLLVAPMLSSGLSHVKVYFPKEEGVTWQHVWSKENYKANGQEIDVGSPLQRPAVFIKQPREDDGLLDEFLHFCNK